MNDTIKPMVISKQNKAVCQYSYTQHQNGILSSALTMCVVGGMYLAQAERSLNAFLSGHVVLVLPQRSRKATLLTVTCPATWLHATVVSR